MRAKLLVALALIGGTTAYAQDATSPAPAALTLAAAKKAQHVRTSDNRSADIYQVEAGPDDSIAFVEMFCDGRAVKLPGATLSATEKTRRLKTNLSAKELSALN